ncbi:MAG TPA: carboxypeptidase-like regulatory domain-containing protein, partial [Bryobacteraceae bacterium]|nr:carboxypeptidase-like regulatory domain-containing protein [Bryobacteraceae bacterium]
MLILFSALGHAQTRGTVSGYVRDASGAVVPAANITLIHQDTGAKRDATTNESGFYQILGLISGSYTLEAEANGFKRYTTKDISLTVDQNARTDIQMELGAVAESVEVKAASALVDTRSATVSGLIDDRRMVDLPLYTRNVIAFAALLPGVTSVSAPANSQVTDSRNGPTVSVNGGRSNQTYVTLNGTYFVNPSRNTGLNVPPPDAVQEFRIKTVNYSAEEGRNSGAIISVITRSGSNALHGSAWEFHRNSALNARSFFDAKKPVGHQNQFGAAAGGPAKKDKIFWFGAYEGLYDRRAASTVDAFPPTAAERAGDFSSQSTPIRNPFANNTPFPNNRIPVSLFDPAAVSLLNFLPTPPASG